MHYMWKVNTQHKTNCGFWPHIHLNIDGKCKIFLTRNTLKTSLCLCLPWTNRVESPGLRKNFSNTVQIIRKFFSQEASNLRLYVYSSWRYNSTDCRKSISHKNRLLQPAVRRLHTDSSGRPVPGEEIRVSRGWLAMRACPSPYLCLLLHGRKEFVASSPENTE